MNESYKKVTLTRCESAESAALWGGIPTAESGENASETNYMHDFCRSGLRFGVACEKSMSALEHVSKSVVPSIMVT